MVNGGPTRIPDQSEPMFYPIQVPHRRALDKQPFRKSFYARMLENIHSCWTSRPYHEMKAYFDILHFTAPDTGTYHARYSALGQAI